MAKVGQQMTWLHKWCSFSGQILYLQAKNQAITLKTTGNIHTNDNADVVLSAFNSGAGTGGEVATLIYDDKVTGGNWVVVNVGSGGGSSSLLTSNNTWTGTNTFTGTTFASAASTSTSITSPVIYIGDQASDVVNITGAISSTATNVWSGINNFLPMFHLQEQQLL